MLAGSAARSVDVPVGTRMAGFAARLGPSTGVHDPMTVRALLLGDLCWIAVDACALHEDTCAEIAARVPHPDELVRVTATHTHAGPGVAPGRLGGADHGVLAAVVEAAVDAVTGAARRRVEAVVSVRQTAVDDVAFDRRREQPVTVDLQAVLARHAGEVVAALVVFPCHPVVLSAANTEISADYPASLRTRLELAWPQARVLFAPGCAGDVNTGHTASSSFTAGASPSRSFAEAERIGTRLAEQLLGSAAGLDPAEEGTVLGSRRTVVELELARLDREPPAVLAARWRAEAAGADPGTVALLDAWITWARTHDSPAATHRWSAPVSVSRLSSGWLVGLPGEPFLGVANRLRAALGPGTVVVGYTDGCPGYFPLRSDYPRGGYEVLDAHRYYGLPAPFAAGSAERLVDTALGLAEGLR
jgi:hypothetical protein